ncbi:MAG: hypothetical protein ACO3JL_06820 [Myxococcota bacterium]
MKKRVHMQVRKPSLRNINAIDDAAMEAFISAPPPGEAVFQPPQQQRDRRQAQSTHRRRADLSTSGESLTRLTVHLPTDLDETLRTACVKHRMSLSHAVEQAVALYLSQLS